MTQPFFIHRRRPVATSSFVPTDIAGLQAWYKADAGITKDGSDIVSAWADQSGNSRNLSASGSAQPLYVASLVNGLPAIRFDGTDDVMTTSAFTVSQPFTVFWCSKNVSFTSNDRLWAGGSSSNNPNVRMSASTTLTMQSNATNGATATTDTTSYAVFKTIFNGTSSVIAKNNGSDSTSASNLTGSMGLVALGGFTAANIHNIEIAEWLLYNSSISGTNLTNLLSYFQSRYALW